jgi:hypothetical protein
MLLLGKIESWQCYIVSLYFFFLNFYFKTDVVSSITLDFSFLNIQFVIETVE